MKLKVVQVYARSGEEVDRPLRYSVDYEHKAHYRVTRGDLKATARKQGNPRWVITTEISEMKKRTNPSNFAKNNSLKIMNTLFGEKVHRKWTSKFPLE